MSVVGQTGKYGVVRSMSAFPLEADTSLCPNDVGFGPTADMPDQFNSEEMMG
jgi:hypothetical protein